MKISYTAAKKLEEFLIRVKEKTTEAVYPELDILTTRNWQAEIIGGFVKETIEVEIPDQCINHICNLIENYGDDL